MVSSLTARRAALVLPLALAIVVLATSCGGGSSGPGHKSEDEIDLVVIAFSHAGRTDVYRNQPVTLSFNVPVKKSSVSDRTIQVRTGPNLKTVAKGRYFIDGNLVTFDPRQDEEILRKRTVINPNPFGFEPLATYQLLVAGPPVVKRLTNKAGKGVIAEFFSTFRTIDEYVPELIQPRFIGDVEHGRPDLLAFQPQQFPEQDPVDNPDEEVLQSSRVTVIFDEPIDPASMDPGTTIIFRNETLTAQFGNEVLVPGTISSDRSATRWTFESAFGFGRGPYDVSVTLGPGIRDLSGNPLGNPRVVMFRTARDDDVPNSNIITESFSNTFKWDSGATPSAVRADWDGSRNGYLVGGAITSEYREISLTVANYPGGSRTRINSPLTDNPQGSHTQMLYYQSELGGAGTIAEVAWGPDSNALFAASHDRVIVKLGHFTSENLTSRYADNFNVGAPVRVYDGGYTIPQAADISTGPNDFYPTITLGYWPWPTFSSYFDYDGTNHVVLDVDVKPGTNFQIHRVFYGLSFSNPMNSAIPNRRLYGEFGAEVGPPPSFQPPGNPEPTAYDMLFVKRRRVTWAQSKWYDSFVPNANYGTPIISPPTQKGGATFVLQFEGAQPMDDPFSPGSKTQDPSTFTGFVENIDLLDGFRYIRFKFTMIANLISDTVPEINSLVIPYIF